MSDTPRVDAEAAPFPIAVGEEAEFDWVPAEFAKELERELAAAQKDAERYRWLVAHRALIVPEMGDPPMRGETIRVAIDEAMKANG